MIIKTNILTIILIAFFITTFAQESVPYYISKTVDYSFEDATTKLKSALKDQGKRRSNAAGRRDVPLSGLDPSRML